ncbi:MAG: S41 family peptidase [Rhodospirillaceae bacterium]
MIKKNFGVLATFCFFLLVGQALAQTNTSETYRQLDLLGDVFERIRADYVREVSDKELIEAAINGMLSSLDPHSSYMGPDSFKDMQVQTRGEFGGLGIEVTMESGYVKVVSPIDDTPAFRAGIKAGDFITQLDDQPVQGLTLAEAVEKMRGKINTDIRLTIRREGREPFEVTLTRAAIKIQSVRWRTEKNIGYVRITSFSEQTEAGLIRAIKKLNDKLGKKLIGLVLDLRNNPGGLLDQAIKVSDAFLDRGEIVSTRARRAEDVQRFNAEKGDLLDGKPIVILINRGSASASEIVAGALQDHRRAVVLGTRSFGKGSVQTIMPLSGQGAIRLTTAQYFTPSGRSIQAKGIEPDIEVTQATLSTVEGTDGRREADLKGALQNPNDAKTPQNGVEKEKTKQKTGKNSDYQLLRALDLIRGITLYGEKNGK